MLGILSLFAKFVSGPLPANTERRVLCIDIGLRDQLLYLVPGQDMTGSDLPKGCPQIASCNKN